MAEVTLQNPAAYFADPRKGKPVYNGSIYIGVPDLDPKIEANRVDIAIIQEDGVRVPILPAGQPLSTGAGGKILYQGSVVTVKITDAVSMSVVDSVGVEVEYFPRLNELTAASIGGTSGEAPVNGSFETEIATGVASNWLISVGAGSVTVDATESAHGIKSMKFTGIDATGGGTATSDKFNVFENSDADIRFVYRSTAPTTKNEVSIRYYDINTALLFIDTVHSESTSNPLTYTQYIYRSTAPALAVQAEIFLDGVNPAGATVVGSTYFDGIFVDYLVDNEVVGENGSVIDVVDVNNSVNSLQISSAATGNKPFINQIGEDVGVDIEGVEIKNGVVTGDLIGNADTVANPNLTGDINTTGTVASFTAPQAGAVVVKRLLTAADSIIKGTIAGGVYPSLTSYVDNNNTVFLGTVLIGGTITVNFSHLSINGAETTSTRVVINQVAGVELSTSSTSFVPISTDIAVNVGDILFLQIKNTGIANDGQISDVFITNSASIMCIA